MFIRDTIMKTKVLKNDSSQTIKLPKEYRLRGKKVTIYYKTWREIYNSMTGLSEEDFVTMNNSISS
jgi:virulence-associated protein VagC